MATIGSISIAKGEIYTSAHKLAENRANDGYGYLTGCDVHQQGTPAMGVTVDAGTVMYAGAYLSVSGGNVTIDAADGTNPRFDIIYINAAGSALVAKGTAAAILPTGETTFKKMTTPYPTASIPTGVILARVYVAAGVTTILNAAIDDIAMLAAQVPVGVLSNRGEIPYRGANEWLALSPGTSGYFLKTQGAAADPVWAADTLTSTMTTRGDLVYRGASAPARLAKGTAGQTLIQGANDPAWTTRTFDIAFPFGDGSVVIQDSRCEWRVPIACKITAARIREISDVSGSITCTLYKRTYSGTWGSALDTFTISSDTKFEETGLNITIDAGDWVSIRTSSITSSKQIVCTLTCEAT